MYDIENRAVPNPGTFYNTYHSSYGIAHEVEVVQTYISIDPFRDDKLVFSARIFGRFKAQ